MQRSKADKKRMRIQRERITRFVESFDTVRAAADAIGVQHTVLWRAQRGHLVRGASLDLVLALVKYTKRSVEFWCGEDEAVVLKQGEVSNVVVG